MSNARRLLDDIVRQLDEKEMATRAVPAASPAVGHRPMCVGMSTYDDFDGVYFTLQGLRLFHPEVLDKTSFLVVDNFPEGPAGQDLKALAESLPGVRYVPFRGFRSTAVRDLVFREADADIVVCVDSHVLLAPGALQAVLDHFDAHPASKDLVQGPLLSDDLSGFVGTHFAPNWGAGMYGQWDVDDRVNAPDGAPFEIEMQGLGVFACRKEAWPGLNPRFRGFGGEEGYLHEKIRQAGGRVLCLPKLAWTHRFTRPSGPPYRVTWIDRVRNYLIGWEEIGWKTTPVEDHFRELLGPAEAELLFSQATHQLANPFGFFDGIFCLNLDEQTERWATMTERFSVLDIGWRVERFSATAAPHGCTLSFRSMVAEARRRRLRSVLIFEDDAVFLDQTIPVAAAALADLRDRAWDLFYLGGCVWSATFPFAEGSRVLQRPSGMTCTHAVAVNHTAYERLLDELPASDGPELDRFLEGDAAIDQYLARRIGEGAYEAFVTAPRLATQPMLMEYPDADLALASRYVI